MFAALRVVGELGQWLLGAPKTFPRGSSGLASRVQRILPLGLVALVVLTFTVLPLNLLWVNDRPTPQLIEARETLGALRAVPDLRIASVGDDREGLVAAWLLGVPWYGDQPSTPDGDVALASGANVFFVGRGSPAVGPLDRDPRFTSLAETASAKVYLAGAPARAR
jgi:hypothetical protein